MKVVWKFTIEDPHAPLRMPAGAVILTTQVQHGTVVVWAEVDPAAPVVERPLHVVPTGGECPATSDAIYVGTVQRMGGSLVFHIYAGFEPHLERT